MTAEHITPPYLPNLSEDAVWEWWELHVHTWRYLYVASQQGLGMIADAACGSGYGTDILRRSGHDAWGFDKDCILGGGGASGHLDYLDLDRPECLKELYIFDTLVSFETLEHLEDPDQFLCRLRNSTRIQTLFASVPVIPTRHLNPFHKHDFTVDSFGGLIHKAGWQTVDLQLQSAPHRKHVYAVVKAVRR
jgi:hypothetical protein